MSRTTRDLTCAPEDVFAVLANGWLYPGWVVGASRMRRVDEDWPAPASRLHHSVGVWPLLVDDSTSVLLMDPPRRLVMRARGWPAGEAEVAIDVVPRPGGCRVTITEDATEGPATLIPGPVRNLALGVRNRETLLRLAMLAEGGAG
ncbi:SRPBCC family protein [Nakamurella sp. YIM 132087]|uniref:SRPBCC family protein n=1 Tax=Nakamurella alba TaxID=2665158 RepID=A0A7K1FQ89_9ACTN|nr:SRPBCC family protein [Nakamurella alba]MTD14964.1 SRPBCC family protein [Nakamurella alba]